MRHTLLTAAFAAALSLASFSGAPRAATALEPTSDTCAVDVTRFATTGGDDTQGFAAAMADAVTYHADCFGAGPSGAPQAVVYVPPGTYALAGLTFPSNVRMEVDAGATLQLPANRQTTPTGQTTPMINWDSASASAAAVQNVTLIGVGRSRDARKRRWARQGGAPLAPFDLSSDFVLDLDPSRTGSTNYNTGLNLADVEHFRIENVITVQNATNQQSTPIVAWPTTSRAAILLHARWNSPIGTGPYLQPEYGSITNQVNVGGPRGYGPNQVNAARYVAFTDIYSSGGTALRLETDGSADAQGVPDRGATVDHLVGRNIVGVNCNRAVALAPHAQHNGYVDISGVWAYSCNEAVAANLDRTLPPSRVGSFDNATVRDVHVTGGYHAQLDSTDYLWREGESFMPVYVDGDLSWQPTIAVVSSDGPFTND